MSGAWYEPWTRETASFTYEDADYTTRATYVRTAAQHIWTTITDANDQLSPRIRTTSTTYDTTYGMPTHVEDSGDEAKTNDQTCLITTYARNPEIGLTSLVSRTQKLATTCNKDAIAAARLPENSKTSGDVISDTATVYDTTVTKATTWNENQKPTKGDATWIGRANGYLNNRTATWQRITSSTYDSLGRPTAVTNAKEKTTTTSYTPDTAEPVTSTTIVNPLDQGTTTDIDPAWQVPIKSIAWQKPVEIKDGWRESLEVTDTDRKITELTYDAVGRLTQVWLPDRPRRVGTATQDSPASMKFAYHVSNTQASWVSTSRLRRNGVSYNTSYALYDALVRERQTQAPSATGGGGRVITTAIYDERGLKAGSDTDIFDQESNPGQTLVDLDKDQRAPAQTRTEFDGASRPRTTTFKTKNTTLWSTSTQYTGDSVATSAPEGGSAIREYTDVFGRLTRRLQYKSPDFLAKTAQDAADEDTASTKEDAKTFLRTRFKYTAGGQLDKVIGPDNSEWSYTYDLFGRQTQSEDPDKGTTIQSFTTADELATSTNGGKTLAYSYDSLGRKRGLWSDADRTDANLLAAWGYDKAPRGVGQLDTATRYVGGTPDTGGKAYTNRITNFDLMSRPLAQTFTLSASDPLVAAGVPQSLERATTYNLDGTVATATEPALVGLPSETLKPGYNDAGLPTSLATPEGIVTDTVYSPLGDIRQYGMGESTTTLSQMWVTNTITEGTRRLASTAVSDGTHAWYSQNTHYDYHDAGNVKSVFDHATREGTSKPDYQCFAYDGYGQLEHAWTPAAADCEVAPSATGLGGPAPYWTQYKYDDATGQRDTEIRHESKTTLTYGYDETHPHQLKTVTRSGGSGATGAAVPERTYDDSGNTLTRPTSTGTQTLTWDPEGHLATSRISGQESTSDTTYTYDPDGNLLIRRPASRDGVSADGDTVLYLGATEVKLTTKNGTNTLSASRYYTHAGDTVAVRTSQGSGATKLIWLAADRNGTSEIAMDPFNTATPMALTRRYTTPFGESRGSITTTTTGSSGPLAVATKKWIDDKGFLGKPSDTSSGLTHLGAREYDASVGRFISVDPILDTSDPLSLNGYTYADNSPITKTDPSGLMASCPYAHDSAQFKACNKQASNTSNMMTPEEQRQATIAYHAEERQQNYNTARNNGQGDEDVPRYFARTKKAEKKHWWDSETWNKTAKFVQKYSPYISAVAIAASLFTPVGWLGGIVTAIAWVAMASDAAAVFVGVTEGLKAALGPKRDLEGAAWQFGGAALSFAGVSVGGRGAFVKAVADTRAQLATASYSGKMTHALSGASKGAPYASQKTATVIARQGWRRAGMRSGVASAAAEAYMGDWGRSFGTLGLVQGAMGSQATTPGIGLAW